MQIKPFNYLIIADNEIKAKSTMHESAQLMARNWSIGRFDTAKVIFLPTSTVQGIWHKGERIK